MLLVKKNGGGDVLEVFTLSVMLLNTLSNLGTKMSDLDATEDVAGSGRSKICRVVKLCTCSKTDVYLYLHQYNDLSFI